MGVGRSKATESENAQLVLPGLLVGFALPTAATPVFTGDILCELSADRSETDSRSLKYIAPLAVWLPVLRLGEIVLFCQCRGRTMRTYLSS
jgi:hypothetical protein